MKLKINSAYASVLTPLPTSEFEALKESISKSGQLIPIVANKNGEILDGHHRCRACDALGIEPKVTTVDLSKDDEIKYVFSVNVNRRHLNPITAVIIASRLYGDGEGNFGRYSEEKVADEFGISKGSFHRARTIVRKHGWEKALKLALSEKAFLNEEYSKIMKEKKKADRREVLSRAPLTASKLFCEDFRKVHIAKESIDAIITDPPYPSEYLGLFSDLIEKAQEWLKPKGSLLVMSGQMFLPEVFKRLQVGDLKYYWTLGYVMPGKSNLIHGRPVQSGWKPVLWYVKDVKYAENFPPQNDWVVSRAPEKDTDEWQQSVTGTMKLVEWVTEPGDVVLDPMMGRGTTGVASLRLKRKFIGIDNDPEAFKDANGRISDEEKQEKL